MHEVVEMVIVECPWCEGEVAFELAERFRCDDCRIEVEISADAVAPEVALAA
jgi:hypothetical protein